MLNVLSIQKGIEEVKSDMDKSNKDITWKEVAEYQKLTLNDLRPDIYKKIDWKDINKPKVSTLLYFINKLTSKLGFNSTNK